MKGLEIYVQGVDHGATWGEGAFEEWIYGDEKSTYIGALECCKRFMKLQHRSMAKRNKPQRSVFKVHIYRDGEKIF